MNVICIAVSGGIRDPVSSCDALILGHVGESNVTQVELDYSAWVEKFGEGTVSLEVLRNGDDTPYAVELAQDAAARRAVWTVSDVDTGKYGHGFAGYCYRVDGAAKKSEVFRFFVDRDVGGPPGPSPDPYEGTVALIRRLAAETAENSETAQRSEAGARLEADRAAQAAAHPPLINVNGTWMIWNAATERYENTGQPSAGEDGFSPTAAVERISGALKVTITDLDGPHVFYLRDAFGREGDGIRVVDENGNAGYIPAGNGSPGSLAVSDGVDSWNFPAGEGAGTDAGVEDEAGGNWYMPGAFAEGSGLPPGGVAGQVLMKVSSADYDAAWTDLPAFAGNYDVTPLVGAQTTLSTQQCYLDRNIVVQAIPYAEVSNIKGGKTATIGG